MAVGHCVPPLELRGVPEAATDSLPARDASAVSTWGKIRGGVGVIRAQNATETPATRTDGEGDRERVPDPDTEASPVATV